eukprot:GFYU01008554.1.p1 GENE.GFYU01008554.1~~GFYU01008554.1.p1  ORF type:complete len:758 (-),score=99.31 GFYU01008554.1:312-2585(-)
MVRDSRDTMSTDTPTAQAQQQSPKRRKMSSVNRDWMTSADPNADLSAWPVVVPKMRRQPVVCATPHFKHDVTEALEAHCLHPIEEDPARALWRCILRLAERQERFATGPHSQGTLVRDTIDAVGKSAAPVPGPRDVECVYFVAVAANGGASDARGAWDAQCHPWQSLVQQILALENIVTPALAGRLAWLSGSASAGVNVDCWSRQTILELLENLPVCVRHVKSFSLVRRIEFHLLTDAHVEAEWRYHRAETLAARAGPTKVHDIAIVAVPPTLALRPVTPPPTQEQGNTRHSWRLRIPELSNVDMSKIARYRGFNVEIVSPCRDATEWRRRFWVFHVLPVITTPATLISHDSLTHSERYAQCIVVPSSQVHTCRDVYPAPFSVVGVPDAADVLDADEAKCVDASANSYYLFIVQLMAATLQLQRIAVMDTNIAAIGTVADSDCFIAIARAIRQLEAVWPQCGVSESDHDRFEEFQATKKYLAPPFDEDDGVEFDLRPEGLDLEELYDDMRERNTVASSLLEFMPREVSKLVAMIGCGQDPWQGVQGLCTQGRGFSISTALEPLFILNVEATLSHNVFFNPLMTKRGDTSNSASRWDHQHDFAHRCIAAGLPCLVNHSMWAVVNQRRLRRVTPSPGCPRRALDSESLVESLTTATRTQLQPLECVNRDDLGRRLGRFVTMQCSDTPPVLASFLILSCLTQQCADPATDATVLWARLQRFGVLPEATITTNGEWDSDESSSVCRDSDDSGGAFSSTVYL